MLERINDLLLWAKTGPTITDSIKEKLYAIANWLFEETDKNLKLVFPSYLNSVH